MKPLRRHVALAVDGGGIRGVIPARALAILEEKLGRSAHDVCRLVAGSSTGAVIAAGVAAGLSGERMHGLYTELGASVFRRSWRSMFWPLTRYRYAQGPLLSALLGTLGHLSMGDLWAIRPQTDLVITVFDLIENRTRFVKAWKPEYGDWPVAYAVLASCSVPTYFPTVDGRYIDGGVGSYSNPCYLAAYELFFCLGWNPADTTLISLGTGRVPNQLKHGDADRYWAWHWLEPVLGAFLQSADDQQVHLVQAFFRDLDFRRFQVDLREPIAMDDPRAIPELTLYGDAMGRKILSDQMDPVLEWTLRRP